MERTLQENREKSTKKSEAENRLKSEEGQKENNHSNQPDTPGLINLSINESQEKKELAEVQEVVALCMQPLALTTTYF